MDFDLNAGWSIEPAGGTTGSAYLGIYAHEKFFLKRNASPFLAALSVEGITPKLIWTKRIVTGDVLTAQEWLNGRTLTKQEMAMSRVPRLLAKVHHSTLLERMLAKVGGHPLDPKQFRDQTVAQSNPWHNVQAVQAAIAQTQTAPVVAELRACHGDLSHKNWLLSEHDELYLVDWDQAILADVAYDLSEILVDYIPVTDWPHWLSIYGLALSDNLQARLLWYGKLHLLHTLTQPHADTQQVLDRLAELVSLE